MWLLSGEKAPDHNTISRFRSGQMKEVIEDLFYQLIIKLGDMSEIAYENIFLDGTKIEANANKYSFVWKKSTQKHEIRLQEKIKLLINEVKIFDGRNSFSKTDHDATFMHI